MGRGFPKQSLLVIFLSLFVVQAVWNLLLYTQDIHISPANFYFNIAYGTTPILCGAIMLYYVFRNPGGEVSSALGYLGTGAICFGLGLYSWAYYNIFSAVPVPHPSPVEVFFLIYPFLLTIGSLRLLVFYSPFIKWRIWLEAITVFFLFAVPIYYYFILPDLAPNQPWAAYLIIIGILIGDSLMMAVVYAIARVGGGKLRGYMLIYGLSFLLFTAAAFSFQYRNQMGLYWNGDISDTLWLVHVILFALASMGVMDIIYGSLNSKLPTMSDQIAPQTRD